jgi:Flp pilus assembly secretin CpaC
VIGGLMETQRIESIRKVPWLGDIPLLGAAFRRTVRSDVKKELMIFLTPHIVSNNETLHKLSEYEMSRTDLIERAYNEDDFNKYLDGPSLFPTHVQEKIDGVPVARATAVKGLPASRATPPPKPRAPASTPAPRQGGAPRPTNPKSLQR